MRAYSVSHGIVVGGAGVIAAALGAAFVLAERALGLGVTIGAMTVVVIMGIGLSQPYAAALAALAFISFDSFLVANIDTVTIRLSTILFGAALCGIVVHYAAGPVRNQREPWGTRPVRAVLWALAALAVAHVLSYFVGGLGVAASLPRLLVILGGAVVPVLVLLLTINTPTRFLRAVVVVIGSQVAVCLYGLYQFSAPYFGLPQGLAQTAQLGGAGRISALSLEPGFFAAYLVTGLPIVLYLASGRSARRTLWAIAPALIIITTLILANARGGYVGGLAAVVVTFGFLAAAGSIDRRTVVRAAVVAALAALTLASFSSWLGFSVGKVLAVQASYTVNLTGTSGASQDTSNQQRRDIYGAAYQMARDHPILGVGDGNAVNVLPRYGVNLYYGQVEGTLNSVPLEVVAETGLLGLAALIFLYVSLARVALRLPPKQARSGRTETLDPIIPQMLLLGGLVLLVVNGLFVTWLWDLRLWAMVGLGLGGLAVFAHSGRANVGNRSVSCAR